MRDLLGYFTPIHLYTKRKKQSLSCDRNLFLFPNRKEDYRLILENIIRVIFIIYLIIKDWARKGAGKNGYENLRL